MIDVVSVSYMRQCDKKTAATVTEKELMRRAGCAVFELLPEADSYDVFCGGGNNGGDGYVIAGLLKAAGKTVRVYRTSGKTTETSAYFLHKCISDGVDIFEFQNEPVKAGVIVDCIFGTGFHGEVKGAEADAINRINESGAYVVSVDINSGLNGDNGRGGLCVVSDITIAVEAYKPGHFLGCAKDVIKRLDVVHIGIDTGDGAYKLCEAADFKPVFPKRKNDSHKGTYGTAVLLGGCREYSGAVKLANISLSALKCGCGISRLAVEESIADYVAPYLLESTLCPLSSLDKSELDRAFKGAASVGLGMGFGRAENRTGAVKYALDTLDCPLLIDADGLYALSQIDYKSKGNVIITPHAAEFARLCGITVSEVLDKPVETARCYAKEHNVVVLLKGASTVVTDGERVYIVTRGAPGMATAGSGDVLSGIITGINAENPADLCLNAACGAWIAGAAGEYAEKEKGEVSMTANDTAGKIYMAVKEIQKN